MIDNILDTEATALRIKLKALSKDVNGNTPFENSESYHLSRFEYIHDVGNRITIVTSYSGSDITYRYVCEEMIPCARLIEHISSQMEKQYRDELQDAVIDRLLF